MPKHVILKKHSTTQKRPDADPDQNRKSRRTAKHAAKHRAESPPMMNLMLMQNDQIQGMIVAGTNSTYVPTPKTDSRPFATLTRARKAAARAAAWNGARA